MEPNHMHTVVAFLLFFAICALITWAVRLMTRPEHFYDADEIEKTPIKFGDCISPNRGAWMTDDEFALSEAHRKEREKIKVNDCDYADIRAMATKVHQYETVIKR